MKRRICARVWDAIAGVIFVVLVRAGAPLGMGVRRA